MKRRNFIKNTAASGIALTGLVGMMNASATETIASNAAKFKLKYAPGLGT
jgi:hydroxypyruvate isomerase